MVKRASRRRERIIECLENAIQARFSFRSVLWLGDFPRWSDGVKRCNGSQVSSGSQRRAGFYKVAEAMTAARMTELAKRFGFDLADALARNREVLAYLF